MSSSGSLKPLTVVVSEAKASDLQCPSCDAFVYVQQILEWDHRSNLVSTGWE